MTQHFIITVLVIYGVHASTRDGMIFSRLYIAILMLLDKVTKYPQMVLKPLFDCTPCMASIYGIISFFIYGELELYYLPIWIFSLSGFNYLLNKILNR